MLFIAYSMIRSGSSQGIADRSAEERSAGSTIIRGILLNVLNPKLTLLFFAFLPQFLSVDATLPSLLGLGAVFMVMTFAVFAVYAILGGSLGTAFSASTTLRHRIEQSMGLLLAGFAVRLALTER